MASYTEDWKPGELAATDAFGWLELWATSDRKADSALDFLAKWRIAVDYEIAKAKLEQWEKDRQAVSDAQPEQQNFSFGECSLPHGDDAYRALNSTKPV